MKRPGIHLLLPVCAALLFLLVPAIPASAGGGCHGQGVRDVAGTRVDLQDMCFVQTILRIQPGQAVTWTNHDEMAHLVTGAGMSWGSLEDLRPGASVTYRFDSAGVYPYACMIHAGMVGAIVVGNGGRAAATETGGAVVPIVSSPAAGSAALASRPASNPAPAASSNAWMIVALVALGLLAVAGTLAGLQWIAVARSQARARAS